ncbi:MAG: hypothetical protein GY875_01400 [Gammaproteobacteria bacterium]|nr:hypothetical protein [Gammaproteobacteria bacterium]
MSRLFALLRSTAFVLLLSILVAVPGSHAAADPAIAFADQIMGEIDALRDQTNSAGIDRPHVRHLTNRLKIASFFVSKGKKKLQQDKTD